MFIYFLLFRLELLKVYINQKSTKEMFKFLEAGWADEINIKSSYDFKMVILLSNTDQIIIFITPILKSLVVHVILLALIDAIYSRITPFFALNHIFFPANKVATLKTKQPIRFQGLFKVTDQIAGKWKTKSIMWQILQLLFPKLLLFPPPQKWMN